MSERDFGRARMTEATRRARLYAALQIGGWTLFGLIGCLISGLFGGLSAGLALTMLFGAALGGIATHLIRRRARAGRWYERPARALLGRLAVAAIAAALSIELAVWGFGLFVTRVYTMASSTPGVMFVTTFNWIVIVVLWLALYSGIRFLRDYRAAEIRRLKSEVAAREAQLGALTAQIHPHFLFNALNTLRALVAEDPARARDLVTELAEILRHALHAGRRDHVALGEELDIVRAYLRLESARFEDRLAWSIDVPGPMHDVLVPPMLVQTLVENAVRHGIGTLPAGGRIEVHGALADGVARLTVTNPGSFRGLRAGGVGLPNARERLQLHYGDAAALDVLSDAHGVRAELSWPAVHARVRRAGSA